MPNARHERRALAPPHLTGVKFLNENFYLRLFWKELGPTTVVWVSTYHVAPPILSIVTIFFAISPRPCTVHIFRCTIPLSDRLSFARTRHTIIRLTSTSRICYFRPPGVTFHFGALGTIGQITAKSCMRLNDKHDEED